MKHLLSSLAFILSLFLAPALVHAGEPVEGKWHTPTAEGTVDIDVEDGVLTGKLVESTKKKAKLGTLILRDFRKSGDGWKGKIYAPKRGKTADATLTLQNGKLVIKVAAGLRTKTIIWTRAG